MTLIMNQILDSKLIEDSDEEEKGIQTIERQENDAMFLWDCVSLFDTEKVTPKPENIPTTTKDMDLLIKDNTTISKIKKLQKNVRGQSRNNIEDKVPKVTIFSQETEQINKPAKLMEGKFDVDKQILKRLKSQKTKYPLKINLWRNTSNQFGKKKLKPHLSF